jgi:hypothetical protein
MIATPAVPGNSTFFLTCRKRTPLKGVVIVLPLLVELHKSSFAVSFRTWTAGHCQCRVLPCHSGRLYTDRTNGVSDVGCSPSMSRTEVPLVVYYGKPASWMTMLLKGRRSTLTISLYENLFQFHPTIFRTTTVQSPLN